MIKMFDFEETWKDKLDDILWYWKEFITNWIYPAYKIKNMLHRSDIIRIPGIKPWDFVDADYQIYYGVMEPLKRFVESEPEKYICWYKDSDGVDCGAKYGEGENAVLMFPELKGKYVFDLIKEIYNFYTKEEKALDDDRLWLLNIWADYLTNFEFVKKSEKSGKSEFFELVDKGTTYSLNDLAIQNLDWKRLKKFDIDQSNFFKDNYVHSKYWELSDELFKKKKYYLHLAIEIHSYLSI